MRFYNGQHQFYAGIDLHARFMQVGVLDAAGWSRQTDRAASISISCLVQSRRAGAAIL